MITRMFVSNTGNGDMRLEFNFWYDVNRPFHTVRLRLIPEEITCLLELLQNFKENSDGQ